jgi:NAD(P)-dependent dehydrogenase (short-subunit alcohol dehydrogenase family)
MANQQNRIALITGGNRGVGLETARELGRLGIHLALGVRDPRKGASAVNLLLEAGFAAEIVQLDLADPATHASAYAYLDERYGKLDILVNNAGVWKESPTASSPLPESNRTSVLPMAILRETFETNFFGTVALTQCLLPLIRKAPAGRIVNVSSIMGSLTLHADPTSGIYGKKIFAYDASKAALNAFTIHLAYDLKDTPIKVNSAHPGWVRTEMGGEEARLDLSEGGKTSARLATLPADGPTGGYFHLNESLPW